MNPPVVFTELYPSKSEKGKARNKQNIVIEGGLTMGLLFDMELINFMIVLIFFLSTFLFVDNKLSNILLKVEGKKRSIYEKPFRSTIKYVFLTIFFLYTINFFIDGKLLAAIITLIACTLLFIFKKQIVSIVVGFYRVANKVIAVDDKVIINREHKGAIREITLNTVKLFKDNNSVLTMNHSDIHTIEKEFEGLVPLHTSIVLSFREDPEKAEEVFIRLTEKLNEKFKDYLLKNEEGEIVSEFVYEGITELNSNYQGIEYGISGNIHSKDYENLRRKINREVAITCYKNNLKTTEHNVFFKTKAEIKK